MNKYSLEIKRMKSNSKYKIINLCECKHQESVSNIKFEYR